MLCTIVLGTLINFLAMKRVNTRGIKLANKCMMMAAIAYNLKKMMKFKTNRPMAHMAQLPKEVDYFFNSLFFFFNSILCLNSEVKSKISAR